VWPPGSADTAPPASNRDHLTLKLGCEWHLNVGNLPFKFGHARPFGSRIIRYVRDGWTDRQTDGQKQRLLPLPSVAGHNNDVIFLYMFETRPVFAFRAIPTAMKLKISKSVFRTSTVLSHSTTQQLTSPAINNSMCCAAISTHRSA